VAHNASNIRRQRRLRAGLHPSNTNRGSLSRWTPRFAAPFVHLTETQFAGITSSPTAADVCAALLHMRDSAPASEPPSAFSRPLSSHVPNHNRDIGASPVADDDHRHPPRTHFTAEFVF
jgi:hypothetical protein